MRENYLDVEVRLTLVCPAFTYLLEQRYRMACSNSGEDWDLPYRMHVDAAQDEELHVTLARAIAAARNEDPGATEYTLYEYIDPGLLDRLYDHAAENDDASWELSFSVGDLDVRLDSDGEIYIS